MSRYLDLEVYQSITPTADVLEEKYNEQNVWLVPGDTKATVTQVTTLYICGELKSISERRTYWALRWGGTLQLHVETKFHDKVLFSNLKEAL